jgi:hypothetical protein
VYEYNTAGRRILEDKEIDEGTKPTKKPGWLTFCWLLLLLLLLLNYDSDYDSDTDVCYEESSVYSV